LSVLAIRYQTIPATINTLTIDPLLPSDLNILIGSAIQKKVNFVMNNTFGFGGHTATSIFGKIE
jgi:3-oxoacyl-[acyl-carrier-protein] synthase II